MSVYRPATLLRTAADRLTAAGLPSGMADARILLAHVLGVETTALATTSSVDPTAAEKFRVLVQRRASWEPVQHLTGVAYFRHEKLHVGPGVFIPRPETEGLVQLVIDWLADEGIADPVVVDLGAGSGAIACALARETDAVVHAIEASEDALVYARRNLPDSVDLRAGDWNDAFPDLDGAADVVVSNPPYVPTRLAARSTPLPRDVAGRDPDEALFAGPDGLSCVREIVPVAARLLRPGGLLAVEHDETHGASAPAVVRKDARFHQIDDHRDLTDRPRYLTARRITS